MCIYRYVYVSDRLRYVITIHKIRLAKKVVKTLNKLFGRPSIYEVFLIGLHECMYHFLMNPFSNVIPF